MYTLYTLLLLILILLTLPIWLWRYFSTPKYRGTLRQRLGLQRPARHANRPIWIHAVSVGEVLAAQGFIKQLAERSPVVLSTVTKTGQNIAKETLPMVQTIFYLPLDLPWSVARVVRRVQPRCLIVIETELWPGLFHAMEKQGIPILLVNGRLSPRSFRNYRKFSPIMKRFLAPVQLFAMQSADDAQRMTALGAKPERIQVTGNIKYDQAQQPPDATAMAALQQRLVRPSDAIVWIAASTHPGEEVILLESYRQLRPTWPNLRLILAPRHPHRTAQITELIQQQGESSLLFSSTLHKQLQPETWSQAILLMDEIGWLTRLYSYAHIAFVGGTLVPHGGQNMLEPAAWGIPILFGPHLFNFKEISAQLLKDNAAICIQHPAELLPTMRDLLADKDRQKALGERAKKCVGLNVGALQRTLAAVDAILEHHPHHRDPS